MKILCYTKLQKEHIKKIESEGYYKVVLVNKKDTKSEKENIKDADIIVGWGSEDVFTLNKIQEATNLKWVHLFSAGIDTLPFEELKKRKILVTNSSGIHGVPISEFVFAMLLSMLKNLNKYQEYKKKKLWETHTGEELYGKTMAIIGVGNIGMEIARKAKAFDMKVIGIKNNITEIENVDEVYSMESLKEVLALSDVVVIALPLTDKTYKLISKTEFQAMKKGAYFVNIGRGKIVDEKELIKALEEGMIKGACLDVFEEEPLSIENPLWEMENVVLTPHISGVTPAYKERATKILLENLAAFKDNKKLINLVDLNKQY